MLIEGLVTDPQTTFGVTVVNQKDKTNAESGPNLWLNVLRCKLCVQS